MRLPSFLQPRILAQAVRAVLSPPFTTKFPREAFQPVESFRGRPRFDEQACIGCGACAEVCPPKCIDVIDDLEARPPKRRLVQHLDACIWCGQCERYCPTQQGIKLSNEYDCVGFSPEDFEERVEKDLLLCELCGSVLAPVDQIRWLAQRLGPLAFANPTLMMVVSRDLGLVDQGVKGQGEEVLRGDRLTLQCPKCRRKTAFAV
ncbi:MAG: 4Fe-4S binding protein [Kiloniellales bacterium]|nr:4Fe-4S binding protein [Kiloniellales bacterium]